MEFCIFSVNSTSILEEFHVVVLLTVGIIFAKYNRRRQAWKNIQ